LISTISLSRTAISFSGRRSWPPAHRHSRR
jgi:hypothetical protein